MSRQTNLETPSKQRPPARRENGSRRRGRIIHVPSGQNKGSKDLHQDSFATPRPVPQTRAASPGRQTLTIQIQRRQVCIAYSKPCRSRVC
jgi:hypothetical protein